MITAVSVGAGLSLAAWIYLLLFRGGFWRADQRLPDLVTAPADWPPVVAVVPARDEAAVAGRAVRSLLSITYPGSFSVILVDDNSTDGTAGVARAAAAEIGAEGRLEVITAPPLERGWTGKMWAVKQGMDRVGADTDFILLTDADVEHGEGTLKRLVAMAQSQTLDLVSLMVRLHCRSRVERLLIPAFVFFFQKLYPFRWINDPAHRIAGAAGGCMLVRRDALQRAGGIEAVRGALIDDCALAARIKSRGAIWLGLSGTTRSIRPYKGLRDIWMMVSRTAFTQLNHSLLLLTGTVLGMLVIYGAPVLGLVWGLAAQAPVPAALGGFALALMMRAYLPTWRLYGRIGPGLFLLPVAGLLYTLMTVDSAVRHWRGRAGRWKGRTFGGRSTARSGEHSERKAMEIDLPPA